MTNRPVSLLSILLFLSLVVEPSVARAQSITSVFQGTGSGTIGAVAFTDADFVITTNADTANVQSFADGWFLVDDFASIAINGVGSAAFSVSMIVFVHNANSIVGFNQDSVFDILDLLCDIDCSTWDMTTSFGPVFDSSPSAINNFVDVGTTLGLLTMNSAASVTYQATVVPEPRMASQLCVGLIGLTIAQRRRRVHGAGTGA
jgi:hypothetical protein